MVVLERDRALSDWLRRAFPKVTIVTGDAEHLRRHLAAHNAGPVRRIVSSLPLFTRPLADRIQLINTALSLMPKGGEFIQFSYALVPPVTISELPQGSELTSSPWIMLNLPPARVWRYKAN